PPPPPPPFFFLLYYTGLPIRLGIGGVAFCLRAMSKYAPQHTFLYFQLKYDKNTPILSKIL
ncbi:MAG: hypothetical protein K2J89_01995, partial [Clostridia bacterium]|nr:hypothetical protein [Clostridia bacterium]